MSHTSEVHFVHSNDRQDSIVKTSRVQRSHRAIDRIENYNTFHDCEEEGNAGSETWYEK